MEQLKPLTPKPSTMVNNKFQLRPPDVVGDSSLCLSDMETSQISSHNRKCPISNFNPLPLTFMLSNELFL